MRRLPTLLLFARAPRPGCVKTRLAEALTSQGAARLYGAFLEDAARVYAGRGAWRSVLCAEPDPEEPALVALFPPPWIRRPQAGEDLGERLATAFEEEFRDGAPGCVAVGSDHPALPRLRLEEAFEALSSGEAALVPAEDGGYCAIGLAAGTPLAEIFREIPWSTAAVLSTTLARMAGLGLRRRVLEPAYDVDRPEDLERLRRQLSEADSSAEDYPSATARCLASLARAEPPR